uniref:PIN domain-containing protein n=1 Tax=Thermofilum pendens TaxID=2269 RepID=A0A7C4FFX1_THEPE
MSALRVLLRANAHPEVVRRGLSLLEEDFGEVHPTLEGYLRALELRRKGFPDIIDLLLYTTALSNGILFLTRDERLYSFLSGEGEETGAILLEEDFLREYA